MGFVTSDSCFSVTGMLSGAVGYRAVLSHEMRYDAYSLTADSAAEAKDVAAGAIDKASSSNSPSNKLIDCFPPGASRTRRVGLKPGSLDKVWVGDISK
jgi:hypothetical protein